MSSSVRESATALRFGRFEVDPRTGELRKDGLKVRLQDQPFQILLLLLERPGELVTREELRQRLWPAETFVSFDQGLNNAVRRLREALGDSADSPRYVETLPRLGYRFIAPIERLPSGAAREAASVPAPAPADPSPRGPARARGPWRAPVLFGLIGAVLGAGVFAAWSGRRPAADPPALRHVTHSGRDRSPAVSPDGRTVAFVSERDGRRRIWLANLRTGEETALTSGPLDDQPRFSPDGGAVMFARLNEHAAAALYRVPVVGGEPRRLLDDARAGDFSPDGRRLAFLRYAREGASAQVLGVAGADGGGARELARLKALWMTAPRFSPDRRYLAVTHGEGAAAVWSTLVLDVDTGQQSTLAPPLAFGALSAPVWTRSGEALLFSQLEFPHGARGGRLVRQDFPSARTRTLWCVWPTARPAPSRSRSTCQGWSGAATSAGARVGCPTGAGWPSWTRTRRDGPASSCRISAAEPRLPRRRGRSPDSRPTCSQSPSASRRTAAG